MGRATATALGLAVWAAVAAPSPAAAADWLATPTLTLGLDNDTNRVLASPAIPSRGLYMSFESMLERDTETLKLQLLPQLTWEHYSDARLSPTDDEGVDATATWLNSERSSLAMHMLLRNASALYSEISSTGIFHLGTSRRDEETDGSWTYEQTERYTMQLSASYSSSKYHGSQDVTLSNYQQSLGSMVESFAWSERLTLSLDGSAGDAQTQGYEQSTHFQSLGVGFQWTPIERLKLSGSGGVSHQATGPLSSISTVGELSVAYSWELGSVSLDAQRQMQPSGYGLFTQLDEASLAASRRISSRLTLETAANIYHNASAFHSAFFSFTYADRTYSRGDIRLDWQRSEHWTLAIQLLYDRQDAPASLLIPEGLSASGWQVSLQSVWTPLGVGLSR